MVQNQIRFHSWTQLKDFGSDVELISSNKQPQNDESDMDLGLWSLNWSLLGAILDRVTKTRTKMDALTLDGCNLAEMTMLGRVGGKEGFQNLITPFPDLTSIVQNKG